MSPRLLERSAVLDRIRTLCGPVTVTRNNRSTTWYVGDEPTHGTSFLTGVWTDTQMMVYVDRHSIDEPQVLRAMDRDGRILDTKASLAPPTVADHFRDHREWLAETNDEYSLPLLGKLENPDLTRRLLDHSDPLDIATMSESALYEDLHNRNDAVVDNPDNLPQRYHEWFDRRFPIGSFRWPDVSFEVVVRRAYEQVRRS